MESSQEPIREAASCFGVPKSTLEDRVSGQVQSGAVSGPKTYLTADEEAVLLLHAEIDTRSRENRC